MTIDAAIIGGTGVGSRLSALGGTAFHVPTEAGVLRGRLLEHEGLNLFLISRHSAGHKVPPHRVNYKAMALALRGLGIKHCLATAAVGSLHEDWLPGTFAACSDFLDYTGRGLTLFDRVVKHRDFTDPMGVKTRNALFGAAASQGITVKEKAVYVCVNGPRYETPHEIQTYIHLGGDVVGMTASSEAILMREAGIDYACLAIITNLACGISTTTLDHHEVEDEMNRSGSRAVSLLLEAARLLSAKQ